MAVLDGVPGRLDAAVFPAPAEAGQVLHPFLGEVEILGAVNWSDADRDVVRQVCHCMVDESPEVHQDLKASDAGKLAVRALRPEDAVPDHLASDARLALDGHYADLAAARWVRQAVAVAELYIQAADQFAE